MPVSTTAILMVSPEGRHLIETVPACVYRMAFSTRFRMMRVSRLGSVSTAHSTDSIHQFSLLASASGRNSASICSSKGPS